MTPPDSIFAQLQRDEGYRQFPYRDTRGIETIGYGFNLQATGLSVAESNDVLTRRVFNVGMALSKALPWTDSLDEIRRAVLLNMAYNMGMEGLQQFHQTLSYVQEGNYASAAAAMLDSEWARQVGERAQRLAKQMETGEWQ